MLNLKHVMYSVIFYSIPFIFKMLLVTLLAHCWFMT